MSPHGKYKIELIGNVVHVFPTGGFNEQGIRQMHKEIASIAPKIKPWALLEHPKDIAGLTPEAIEELVSCYKSLSSINCVVAALQISGAWQGVFETRIVDKVNIPVYLDCDLALLEKQITHILDNI